MSRPVTIIIADDCDVYRKALAQFLAGNDMEVIATVANGLLLIEQVKLHQPDIVLIDMRMPDMDGITACRYLHELYPHIGKIVVTMYDQHFHEVQEILKAGANGFLNKDANLDEFKRCIEAVHKGSKYYGSSCCAAIDSIMNGQVPAHDLPPHLVDLLQLIGEGYSSEAIAAMRNKSVDTIGLWRRELAKKTGAKNLVELIKFGMKRGIIKNE